MPANTSPRLKPNMLQAVAEKFRSLSEPLRLQLLDTLRNGERSVGELVAATGAGQANVSKHLQILFQQGFVTRRKAGTSVVYAIHDPRVFALCDLVCGTVEDEIDQKHRLLKKRRL